MKLRLYLQYSLDHLDVIQLKKHLPPTTIRRWVLKALNIDTNQLDNVVLTLRWVDEEEGRELNRNYRGLLPNGMDKNYPTNVLTFSYGFESTVDQKNNMSADIVLCWPVLLAEAHAQSKSIRHHAAHLIIHGVLHALGFDHELEEEAKEMEGIETNLLAELNVFDPYIDHV